MRASSSKTESSSAVAATPTVCIRRSRRILRASAAALGIAAALCLVPAANAATATAVMPTGFSLPTPWSVFQWLTGGPSASLWPTAPSVPAPQILPAPQVPNAPQVPIAQQVPTAPKAPAGPRHDHAIPQVLAQINRARAQAGLPAYTVSSGLTHSATAHNRAMVGGCGLSHQCAGEDELGARESAAAVRWNSAGENIAEGGPVADTDAAIAQMAVGLNQDMLAETPPDDGHRRNMLSNTFRHIGIAIHRDQTGTVWMTQDFSD